MVNRYESSANTQAVATPKDKRWAIGSCSSLVPHGTILMSYLIASRRANRYLNSLRSTSTLFTSSSRRRNGRFVSKHTQTRPGLKTLRTQLYDQFEKRAQISINKFIRDNTIVKKCVALHLSRFPLVLKYSQSYCSSRQFYRRVALISMNSHSTGHDSPLASTLWTSQPDTCKSSQLLRNNWRVIYNRNLKGQFEESEDPTILVASEQEKELARATKAMGALWVVNVSYKRLYFVDAC